MTCCRATEGNVAGRDKMRKSGRMAREKGMVLYKIPYAHDQDMTPLWATAATDDYSAKGRVFKSLIYFLTWRIVYLVTKYHFLHFWISWRMLQQGSAGIYMDLPGMQLQPLQQCNTKAKRTPQSSRSPAP